MVLEKATLLSRSANAGRSLTQCGTMVLLVHCWPSWATGFASAAATRGRFISPLLLALRPSLYLGQPILPATARIGQTISFFARLTLSPRTPAKIKLTPPCCKSKCLKFSPPFAAAWEFLLELRRRFLCALARAPQLPSCDSRSVVRAAHSRQHSLGSADRLARLTSPRPRRRPSAQAGSPHGYRAVRLHSQSPVFWQRHPNHRSSRGHAFLGIGGPSVRLLCTVLFLRHAQGRSRASTTSRGCVR